MSGSESLKLASAPFLFLLSMGGVASAAGAAAVLPGRCQPSESAVVVFLLRPLFLALALGPSAGGQLLRAVPVSRLLACPRVRFALPSGVAGLVAPPTLWFCRLSLLLSPLLHLLYFLGQELYALGE